jgi:hypothetical protein
MDLYTWAMIKKYAGSGGGSSADLSDYLKKTDAASTYLSQASAESNYAKKGTTIADYGITDGYTKTEVDNLPLIKGLIYDSKYSNLRMSSSKAYESNSVALGSGTTANGYGSFSEGLQSTASGTASHAEGYMSTASESYTHAEGSYTIASGQGSHVEGNGTTAKGSYQHAQGKYNIVDTANIYAHIVGNGASTSAKSNAHTLDWHGNAWFSGDVYTGSTSGTNKDDGSKKLATEEFVSSGYTPLTTYSSYALEDAAEGDISTVSAASDLGFSQDGVTFTAMDDGSSQEQIYMTKIEFTTSEDRPLIGITFYVDFYDEYGTMGALSDCQFMIGTDENFSNSPISITNVYTSQRYLYLDTNNPVLYLGFHVPANCSLPIIRASISLKEVMIDNSTTDAGKYALQAIRSYDAEQIQPTLEYLNMTMGRFLMAQSQVPISIGNGETTSLILANNAKYEVNMSNNSTLSIDGFLLGESAYFINTSLFIYTGYNKSATFTINNGLGDNFRFSGDDVTDNVFTPQYCSIYKIDFDIYGAYILAKVTRFSYPEPLT